MMRRTPPLRPAMCLVFLAAAFEIIGVVSWQPQPQSRIATSQPYSPHCKTFPRRMKQRLKPRNLVFASSDSSSSSSSSDDVDEDSTYVSFARRCKITTTNTSSISIRKLFVDKMRQMATTTLLLLMLITDATLTLSPVNAMTAADLQSGDISTEELMKALQPATKERPPIAFSAPSSSSSKTAASKIVPPTVIPALIGLANPQIRPNPSDTLIIRVYKDKTAQELLGGAKIPVNKIRRFPLQVQLTPSNNAINPQRKLEWKELANQQEFFVQVTVESSSSTTAGTTKVVDSGTDEGAVASSSSDDQESSNRIRIVLEASSESIVLSQLPGLDANDWETLGQSGIRPPLTLTLRPPVSQ